MVEDEMMTAVSAGKFLKISTQRVYDIIQDGRFTPYVLVEGKLVERPDSRLRKDVFVPRSQVESYAVERAHKKPKGAKDKQPRKRRGTAKQGV